MARKLLLRLVLALFAFALCTGTGVSAFASNKAPAAPNVLKPVQNGHAQKWPATPNITSRPFRLPDTVVHFKGARGGKVDTSRKTFVTGGLNQPGLNAASLDEGQCCSPPDSTGAAGPGYYVEMVNSMIAVYSTADLSLQSSIGLEHWMYPGTFAGATGWIYCDPQIEWDPSSQRWLYAFLNCDPGDPSNPVHNEVPDVHFGWSKTSDPRDFSNGWCNFAVGTYTASGGQYTSAYLDDYPKLGHDSTYMVIGDNVFDLFTGAYKTASIWAIRKPANGSTSCAGPGTSQFGSPAHVLRQADGAMTVTPVPANTADTYSQDLIAAADSPGDVCTSSPPATSSRISMWHIVAGSTPSLSSYGDTGVGSFQVPPCAAQQGGVQLDTLDARLTQAVSEFDPSAGAQALWTQHTIRGGGGHSIVQWYELIPSTRGVRQKGQVTDANDDVFNAAISPSRAGNDAAIFYSRSGSTHDPVIGARSRMSTDTLSTMGPETVVGSSVAADADASCTSPSGPPCRWGDYSGASPDPYATHQVWGTNMVTGITPSGGGAQWTTRNFEMDTANATVPGTPAAPTASAGNTTALVKWTAPASGGTPILSYTITPYVAAVAQTPVVVDGSYTYTTVTGLTNGTTYDFTVTATNGVGNSTESGHSNSVTPSPRVAPAPAPSATPSPLPSAGTEAPMATPSPREPVGNTPLPPPTAACSVTANTVTLGSTSFGQLLFDPATAHVFISSPGGNAVYVFNCSGLLLKTISNEAGADGMAIHNGTLYVVDSTAGHIEKIDTAHLTDAGSLGSGLVAAHDLVWAGGYLWTSTGTCTQWSTSLARVDPDSGTVTTYLSGQYCLALRGSSVTPNTLIGWDLGLEPATIKVIDVTNGTPTLTLSKWESPLGNLQDIAVNPDGTHFITASGAPYEFDEWNISDLNQDGVVYPANAYPEAVATTSAKGGLMAGGLNGLYSHDLYAYPIGNPVSPYIWGDGNSANSVLPHGLAYSTDAAGIFAVTSGSGSGAILHVLVPGGAYTSTLKQRSTSTAAATAGAAAPSASGGDGWTALLRMMLAERSTYRYEGVRHD